VLELFHERHGTVPVTLTTTTLRYTGHTLHLSLCRLIFYHRELTKLQDEVGTFPHEIAMSIISEELGVENPEDIYEFDPPLPIASASIGIVYRARIKKTNKLVAVKVRIDPQILPSI
jgi:ABC1 atypical kinase-like domain